MSAALNNVATTDKFTDAASLAAPGTVRVNLQVSNAAIYWQHAEDGGGGGAANWRDDPEFLLPGFHSFDLQTAGVRVRSAVAGKPARVTIVCRTASEVGGA